MVNHRKLLKDTKKVKAVVVTRRIKNIWHTGMEHFEKDAHQQRHPNATTQYKLNQMKPDVTSETLIPKEDFGINRHEPERQNEEIDVRSATSEVKQPSTRHYDQCDMMFRIRAEPHPKRKSAPQRRIDAAENLHSV